MIKTKQKLFYTACIQSIVQALALSAACAKDQPQANAPASLAPGLKAGELVPDVPGWTLINKNIWHKQSLSNSSENLVHEDESTLSRERGQCREGMVQVVGKMHMGDVESVQDKSCKRWDDKHYRCFEFDETLYKDNMKKHEQELAGRHAPTSESMSFCIDRFEFPNTQNENPIVDVTFDEAKDLCKAQNKRLCTENEWTFACEGPDALPYPYGYTRESSNDNPSRGCNSDNPTGISELPEPRGIARRGQVIAHLWHGKPSGTQPGCKSPFGVYDLTGNVDEWATNMHEGGYPSIMKGGYWSTVRTRCRPSTRAHGPDFSFYQQGFRCCADLGRSPRRTRRGSH